MIKFSSKHFTINKTDGKPEMKIIPVFLLGMFLTACGGGGGGGNDSGSASATVDLSTPQGYFTARVSEKHHPE